MGQQAPEVHIRHPPPPSSYLTDPAWEEDLLSTPERRADHKSPGTPQILIVSQHPSPSGLNWSESKTWSTEWCLAHIEPFVCACEVSVYVRAGRVDAKG